jgi:hypothetical protein
MEQIYLVALVILLLLLLFYTQREYFDVYFNHDEASAKLLDKPVDEAATWSRYNWNERDSVGLNIYDKYYEKILEERNNEGSTVFTMKDVDNYKDHHPVFIEQSGEKIYLSQKNF